MANARPTESKQMSREDGARASGEKKAAATLQGLPLETSPYLKYDDLEDYKRQGYGTQGHLQVNPNQGGGGTDAPTISGGQPHAGANR